MAVFGAWLFIIGLFLHPIIFIISCILSAKYKDDIHINNIVLDVSNFLQYLCWMFIVGGMLLVHLFYEEI